MKAQLNASLKQSLNVSAQLQQSIHLLQLSNTELEQELAQAVESNPLLEWADNVDPTTAPPARAENGEGEEPRALLESSDTSLAAEEHWTITGSGSADEDRDDNPANRVAEPQTLSDYLLWQLHLSPLNARDQRIGLVLIDSLDEDGYLRDSLGAIAQTLLPEIHASEAEISTVLQYVQHFDPVGIAARNLNECLSLQLDTLPADTPGVALARHIADHWLEQLPRMGAGKLADKLKHPVAEVEHAISLLRSLEPRPGRQMERLAHDTYLIPDCIVWKQNGRWQVTLAPHAGSKVVIHRGYEQMIGTCKDPEASHYLRSHLQQAQWLLKGLQARGQTLLRVMQRLLYHQSAFLEFGEHALRPLTLNEIASELGLHESTISRTISRKYARIPRGTIALRAFFSSGVNAQDGSQASSTAISAMIGQLIGNENPSKPWSDSKLVSLLKAQGVTVARRTVAKYREAIGLPPSHERVRRL